MKLGKSASRVKESKALWMLIDQGIVSSGTFLLGVIVARSLGQHEYGLYALAFSLIISLGTLQASLVGNPLIIKGAGLDAASFRKAASSSMFMTVIGGSVFALALVALMLVYGMSLSASFAAGFALIGWHLQQASRLCFIARQEYRRALLGDVLAYWGRLPFLIVVARTETATLIIVLLLVGVTSLLGTLVQVARLGLRPVSVSTTLLYWAGFRALGKWMFYSSVVSAVALQGFIWVLAVGRGSETVAEYQAIMNVMGITHPILFSLTSLIMPAVAVAAASGSLRYALRVASERSMPLLAMMGGLLAVIGVWSGGILRLMYGDDSPYLSLVEPLRWLVLAYVAQTVVSAMRAYLNAVQRPRYSFWSEIAVLVGFIVLGVPLALRFGTSGAAAGFTAVFVVSAGVTALLVSKLTNPHALNPVG